MTIQGMVSSDTLMRLAAFQRVQRLMALRGHLTTANLAEGFTFEGRRYPITNAQRGIFKPKEMTFLLSVKTVLPAKGRRVWYQDQHEAHENIYRGAESVEYSFMGENPDAADNCWLKDAHLNQIPIIYFLGVAPGLYHAIAPAYISRWMPDRLRVELSFGLAQQVGETLPEYKVEDRRYALREVRQRLHQAAFRAAVIHAYKGRCALSNLPESLLLDAAHIISDKDDAYGQPVIPNGLPLSKIHHAAFDNHLIGIDADYRVHVAHRLLDQKDGPVLEALKQLHGRTLILPDRADHRPDRDRLALRFETYKELSLG